MARDRYPLEGVQVLRRAELARSEEAFARACDVLRAAEARAAQARHALAEHEARRPEVGTGRTSSVELRRAAAHARAHAERTRTLREGVLAAGRAVEAHRREVDVARAGLGGASAAERLVARDRDRFEAEARLARERTEEAEADELEALRRRA